VVGNDVAFVERTDARFQRAGLAQNAAD